MTCHDVTREDWEIIMTLNLIFAVLISSLVLLITGSQLGLLSFLPFAASVYKWVRCGR
jgi:hypothetical protein